jgi:hypothetical protein
VATDPMRSPDRSAHRFTRRPARGGARRAASTRCAPGSAGGEGRLRWCDVGLHRRAKGQLSRNRGLPLPFLKQQLRRVLPSVKCWAYLASRHRVTVIPNSVTDWSQRATLYQRRAWLGVCRCCGSAAQLTGVLGGAAAGADEGHLHAANGRAADQCYGGRHANGHRRAVQPSHQPRHQDRRLLYVRRGASPQRLALLSPRRMHVVRGPHQHLPRCRTTLTVRGVCVDLGCVTAQGAERARADPGL